jgi:hypothetical protein
MNVTATVALWPGPSVSGKALVFAVNPLMLEDKLETVTLAAPEFVSVAGRVSDCPITTSPKRSVVGLKTMGFAVACAAAPDIITATAQSPQERASFKTIWGRVMTASLIRERPSEKVSVVQEEK